MITSIDFSNAFLDLSSQEKIARRKAIFEALGNIQHQMPFPIHIVGTNGKGSTIAFLRAILQAAGFSCHIYTSPNLQYINERIVVADKLIEDAVFFKYQKKILQKIPFKLQFFELITALAFAVFADEKADFSLIEAGIGGRLDTTNTILSQMTLLTSIGHDHQEVLGKNLEDILEEKWAVHRKNTPMIFATQKHQNIQKKILQKAQSPNDFIAQRDFFWEFSSDRATFHSVFGKSFTLSKLALAGVHQYENAATAAMAAMVLSDKYGFSIPIAAIQKGLENAIWSGRCQLLQSPKLNLLDLKVWLDGAHNKEGLEVMLDFILNQPQNIPKAVIFGALAKKNPLDFLFFFQALHKYRIPIFLTGIHSSQKSHSPEHLAHILEKENIPCAGTTKIFHQIFHQIPQKTEVFILGSLYLAGEVLDWINEK